MAGSPSGPYGNSELGRTGEALAENRRRVDWGELLFVVVVLERIENREERGEREMKEGHQQNQITVP